MPSITALRAAALSLITLNLCNAQNEPSFVNIEDPTDYILGKGDFVTPTFPATLIHRKAPYNTD